MQISRRSALLGLSAAWTMGHASLALAAALGWRFIRTGGVVMLRSMGGAPR